MGKPGLKQKSLMDALPLMPQVATFTYDFERDGGAVGTKDVTLHVANPPPVGSICTYFCAKTLIPLAGAGGLKVGNTSMGADAFGGTYTVAAGWDDTSKIEMYSFEPEGRYITSDEETQKVILTILTAPFTAGKIQFYLYYLPPVQV